MNLKLLFALPEHKQMFIYNERYRYLQENTLLYAKLHIMHITQ